MNTCDGAREDARQRLCAQPLDIIEHETLRTACAHQWEIAARVRAYLEDNFVKTESVIANNDQRVR